VLELNASDERGIDVVRNRIKMFAQKKVTLPPGRHKVIILDEADSMTSSAQQALRRTMELFSNTTRFALACNISTKIIEPIQSRCAILRFSKLTDQEVLNRIIQVIQMENVSFENPGLEALVFSAEGDMRNALNNLQATVAGFGHVSDANVFKVVDQPHPLKVRAVVDACLASDIYLAQSRLEELWKNGYSCYDLIGTFFKVVKYNDMSEPIKLEFIKVSSLSNYS
jgi:replication factor C subunit 2/4